MTKTDLQQYRALAREAEQLRGQVERLEAAMTAPGVQRLDGLPGGGAGEGSALEALVARREELLALYREKLTALAAAQLNVERAIEGLEPTERCLMRLRYLDGLRWEKICVRMAYSWRGVHKIHLRALERLKEKLPGEPGSQGQAEGGALL